MRRPSLLLLILLLLVPLAVCAQVYKWTDAHGTVHYSDSQPPHGVKYARINVAGATSEPVAQGSATTATDSAATESPAPPSSSNGRVADTPANRQQLCDDLTANMNLLKASKPVVMRGPDGKNQLLSKDRKAQELAKAQKQYDGFCQG